MRSHQITACLRVGAAALALAASAGAVGQTTAVHARSFTPHLPPAGPNRPASVPENYVVTPFGYFHPSCVHVMAEGERALKDGRLVHADGKVDAKPLTCGFDRFTTKGQLVTRHQDGVHGPIKALNQSAKSSSDTNTVDPSLQWDYLDTVEVTTDPTYTDNNYAYQSLSEKWRVPPSPTDAGQLLYYFPGFTGSDQFVDNGDGTTTWLTGSILQPVLDYWGGQWAITSWNCCSNFNMIYASMSYAVSPGDEILGTISNNCPDGSTPCPTWNVVTSDLTNGLTAVLGETPINGNAPNWVMTAALETDYVGKCSDLPPGGQTTFYDIRLYGYNNQLIPKPTQEFVPGWDPADDPTCNYGFKQHPNGDITITYGPLPPGKAKNSTQNGHGVKSISSTLN